LPSVGVYEKHAKTALHERAVAVEITRKKNEAEQTHLPVVFVSVYEHNSNLLPWRETGARIVVIPITENGDFDYEVLENKLREHTYEKCLKVGAFTAGSNLTGTLFDTDRIAIICHTYGCLATFDYAAVAPYVEINMNAPSTFRRFEFDCSSKHELAFKDAVFISPHKFIGGPGSSGVLIAKKNLLFDRKPDRAGGGPVFFVNEIDHEYMGNVEELEEAGTPGVLQDIRAGLVFQLKE
jgi:selenocysteine lyase/cysteine desulfurase